MAGPPHYKPRIIDKIEGGGAGHPIAAYKFLYKLVLYRRELVSESAGRVLPVTWLLPFRNDFRQISAHITVPGLQRFLRECDTDVRPLAVWLLGRSASRFHLFNIADYRYDPSQAVRKQVAKALRRQEAWLQLGTMAMMYPDDAAIQWYAEPDRTVRPFSSRMATFIRANVDTSRALDVPPVSRMVLWIRDAFFRGKPAKSDAFIRRILQRIRDLVHGNDGTAR